MPRMAEERICDPSGWGGGRSEQGQLLITVSPLLRCKNLLGRNPSNRSEREKKGPCVALNPEAHLTSSREHLDQVNPWQFYIGYWISVGGRKDQAFLGLRDTAKP